MLNMRHGILKDTMQNATDKKTGKKYGAICAILFDIYLHTISSGILFCTLSAYAEFVEPRSTQLTSNPLFL
jgi:hypothetical protein